VCDLDEARAQELGERYDCDWTASVENLASSNVEAVSIATPDFAHFGPAGALPGE
jgi:predicted dehydrogenase